MEQQSLRDQIALTDEIMSARLDNNITLAAQIKNNLALNKVDEKIQALRKSQLQIMEGLGK